MYCFSSGVLPNAVMHNACSPRMNSRPHVPKQPLLSPVHFDWQLLRTETMETVSVWNDCRGPCEHAKAFLVRGNILTWAAGRLKSTLIEHVLKLSIPALNALGGFYRWRLIAVFTESCFCHDVRNFKLMLWHWSVEYHFWYQHWSVLSFHQKESEKAFRLTFGQNYLDFFF